MVILPHLHHVGCNDKRPGQSKRKCCMVKKFFLLVVFEISDEMVLQRKLNATAAHAIYECAVQRKVYANRFGRLLLTEYRP